MSNTKCPTHIIDSKNHTHTQQALKFQDFQKKKIQILKMQKRTCSNCKKKVERVFQNARDVKVFTTVLESVKNPIGKYTRGVKSFECSNLRSHRRNRIWLLSKAIFSLLSHLLQCPFHRFYINFLPLHISFPSCSSFFISLSLTHCVDVDTEKDCQF